MGQPQKSLSDEQQILALCRVLQSLREEDDVDVLIATTISYIQQEFDYSLIWIALYDRLQHTLFGKGGITPDQDKSFLHKRVFLNPGDILEQVVIEQGPLGVVDLRNENRAATWQELGRKHNIQGAIFWPIRHKNRFLGLLLLGSKRWGYLLTGDTKTRLTMILGVLGAVLYQKEIDLQQQQTKRPDEPLLKLLENIRVLNNLDQRLKAVVEATHNFVSPSRTNIYWFERQGRYFWCRMSNHLVNIGRDYGDKQQAPGMTVQELSELYYALSVNEIVWIGDARSSLQSHFTAKLLKRLQVRSLLAAPILWHKDLLGFLAVEDHEPRIWAEADKNFLQGAAGLISLVAPIDSMESTIKQIQDDTQLTSQVAQAIYHKDEFNEILRTCATKVLARLAATRFLLLQYDADQNNYQIIYQSQPHNRRPLTFALNDLAEVDNSLLKNVKAAVEVEKLDEDLRFFNWRHPLIEHGVRSQLICNCTQGHAPTVLVLLTHETHRTWSTLEKELLWVVSQQIGVIVQQWQLQIDNKQQRKVLFSIQQCLTAIEHSDQNPTTETREKHLERTVLEQIVSVLDCPLALILSWSSGEIYAEIIELSTDTRFKIVADAQVTIKSEALIQWALCQDSYLSFSVDDLPPETRKWLNGLGIGQILILALRTAAAYEPTGIVVIADHRQRQWSQLSLNATETLVTQLAWSRRQQQVTQLLESTNEELQQLNWYKHSRLEEIQRTTALILEQIHDLGIPSNDLTRTRYQLLLQQLDQTTASMTGLLKLEQWQLHKNAETMPISTLLKRSLERVETLFQQHKLWVGVHGLGQSGGEYQSVNSPSFLSGIQTSTYPSSMAIAGDIVKIELILHELLVFACQRSKSGGRIDIWCRRLDEELLELSITDNGFVEPQLLAELDQNIPKDVLKLSPLDQPPGLHLLICQNLIQQLGGELHIYQLPDSRVVSRLMLPLAGKNH
ncbi:MULTISPECIES: GAF domain-containing protein [unclassified Nodularia (in: cyanobacteria)]|uniref:sensor histidine kinase n=1 Tax=unclassified Nodularia (in: cyanobacteria) TaxID=2656917 RepID=UPI001881A29A|nr:MULTISPECIES: GAF domain-containing protein [unclassified Nodularia (in: cyanobacteria)]MBE9199802.1 GAF domain-containing protein [Nodularia sp. LEGE 06071]MCC2692793.1 GAF domain-containing protein [Nodularia sp. LEGE 04288]